MLLVQVMKHRIHQAAEIYVNKSLEVLSCPEARDNLGHEASDHVLRLVGPVFRLAKVER